MQTVARHTMLQHNTLTAFEISTSDMFLNFIKAVRTFCECIEGIEPENSVLFLQLCQVNLEAVYSGGRALQEVSLVFDVEIEETLTKAQLQSLTSSLAIRLENYRYYWIVSDPLGDTEITPGCG